jgi:hypothetical protein
MHARPARHDPPSHASTNSFADDHLAPQNGAKQELAIITTFPPS